ncbi:hypothetical protein [Luteolibacter soli]|uniref:WYL domain-containing protein n=1 Tax=Luteolibacter soli TaxID=3135280 RepID=A0ABU9AV27_9BACT
MQTPVSLETIRGTIVKRQRARFVYERRTPMVADLYLLGHARRSSAYVVMAWCVEPTPGWRVLRYAEIRDFERVGPVDVFRGDFDPYDRQIMTIDTQVLNGGGLRRN